MAFSTANFAVCSGYESVGESAASGPFAAHPLDIAETLGAHTDEAEILEGVAEFVLGEKLCTADGQPPKQSGHAAQRWEP